MERIYLYSAASKLALKTILIPIYLVFKLIIYGLSKLVSSLSVKLKYSINSTELPLLILVLLILNQVIARP